ncbi:hypothetical protein BDQ17DRAFT_1390588 [Cyathus striatus]|nr:hypothetical protein BDQ17DRAFT_1390588 [Cyathus striatus]
MYSIEIHFFIFTVLIPFSSCARAGFSVHYPWATRTKAIPERFGLEDFVPFCGKRDIIHNPQRFAGYSMTFLSFSGNAGDLVSVKYTTNRVPRRREDFNISIVSEVPIAPSGQLCINIQMPTPSAEAEYGILLFEAVEPHSGDISHFCSDIRLDDTVALAEEHPAMCAKNNETLIPMPEEFLS